ncbi:MAG: exo-alpha-sialidase, partial [Calditrichaeota bacterium]|nr:exo-alpha-sialidase [Calditrichota bacterium]
MESNLQNGKQIVLRIEPSLDNPRNSEGDFVRLKDGRILFVYTHFTGGTGDESSAYLAGRFSTDDGRTWTSRDTLILPNEGKQNTMSVSLLHLRSGKIALFYLRKNSDTDCVPMMRLSTDEAQTWNDPVPCIREPGYYVMNNDRALQLKSGRLLLPLAL